MSLSNKKKKLQRQLVIAKLDEMLWHSSPLGKFLGVIKNKNGLSSQGVISKNTLRPWVVRLPSISLGYKRMGPAGFQTIVIAGNSDQALDKALDCDIWEVLDFSVNSIQVFLKEPF